MRPTNGGYKPPNEILELDVVDINELGPRLQTDDGPHWYKWSKYMPTEPPTLKPGMRVRVGLDGDWVKEIEVLAQVRGRRPAAPRADEEAPSKPAGRKKPPGRPDSIDRAVALKAAVEICSTNSGTTDESVCRVLTVAEALLAWMKGDNEDLQQRLQGLTDLYGRPKI